MSFLDFFVHKANPHGPSHLVHRPHIKPTARHIPLSSASCQAPAVHRSWPRAEILRMHRRSSSLAVGRCWARRKVGRFKTFFMRPDIVRTCETFRRCQDSQVAQTTRLARPTVLEWVVRAILPYRRELGNLPRRLEQLCCLWKPLLLVEARLAFDFTV